MGYGLQPIDLAFRGQLLLADRLSLPAAQARQRARAATLDATGRLFSVGSIDFAPGEDGFPQITANLRVNAYVYSPMPVAPPAGVPPTTDTTTTSSSTDAVASGVTH